MCSLLFQKENIIFAIMPLTTLCFKATDQNVPSPDLIEEMLEFLRTDTVCYRAPVHDQQLHNMENERYVQCCECSQHLSIYVIMKFEYTSNVEFY